jgi:hypothetical protein
MDCPENMAEGEMCTVKCRDYEQRIGVWTCLWGTLRGRPTCLDREGDYWKVGWLRPKITGGFDIETHLRRGVNASNITLAPFALNISEGLTDVLPRVRLLDFEVLDIFHMWESGHFIMKGWETGFPTLWKIHIWRVTYELIVWDVNTYQTTIEGLHEILNLDSNTTVAFSNKMRETTDMVIVSILPNAMPIAWNDTIVASGDIMAEGTCQVHPSLFLWLLIACATIGCARTD